MTSRIIAVGNLKGGTGKSTIAVNLACRLAERQRSAMLIDADPQGTAAAWLRKGTPQGLALISMPLDRAASSDAWQDDVSRQRRRQQRIVIDLPPQKGECFEAALGIADLLIVPVTLSELDLHATAQALMVLHRTRNARAGRPSCLMVPSKVDRRTTAGRQAGTSLARLGCEVGFALGQRAAHAEAFGAAKWIGAHAPGSAAHVELCRIVEQVEDLLGRCQEPEDARPASAPSTARRAPEDARAASVPATTRRAPLRIGALLLTFVTAFSVRPRRTEGQASVR